MVGLVKFEIRKKRGGGSFWLFLLLKIITSSVINPSFLWISEMIFSSSAIWFYLVAPPPPPSIIWGEGGWRGGVSRNLFSRSRVFQTALKSEGNTPLETRNFAGEVFFLGGWISWGVIWPFNLSEVLKRTCVNKEHQLFKICMVYMYIKFDCREDWMRFFSGRGIKR